jgi:hypothetical protein
VTEVAVRHNVPLPASIAMTGKAFAQMQLTAAELDPTLDPFSVASGFVLRRSARGVADAVKPQNLFYEAQKARLRLLRAIEALEGIAGSRPGAGLKVTFRGTEHLEETIAKASRRLSLALGFSAAIVGAAMAMNARRPRR